MEEINKKLEDTHYSCGNDPITRTGSEMLKTNPIFTVLSENETSGCGGDFDGVDGFSYAAAYEANQGEVRTRSIFDDLFKLAKPDIRKNLRGGKRSDLAFASCSMQGWRKNMEDFSTSMAPMRHPFEVCSFFGIFDGHGGSGVARYCSEHMASVLTDSEEFGLIMNGTTDTKEDLIRRGFLEMDDRVRLLPEVSAGHDTSGSTAICALVTPSMIFLANCGDSGAIIVSKGGVEVETRKHKPTERTEKDRIHRAGGEVSGRRVGTLAVSRGLGDFRYKCSTSLGLMEQLVSPEPEIFQWVRNPHDEFVVLASDGVWDVMSSEDVHRFVRSNLLITDDLELICGELAACCLEKRSRDNISVTIILLVGATSISEVTRVQQQAMHQWVEMAVRDLSPIIGDSPIDLVTLSFMINRICNRKGQDFSPKSTTHAHIIAERAWRTRNPCKPLLQFPANGLQELDMAVLEQYLCMQTQVAMNVGTELCGEVCKRNCRPLASCFSVCRLDLDCQTNQASFIEDNMILEALPKTAVHIDDEIILKALPKIAVRRLLYFQNDGESKMFPAVAYFFLPADNGTLRVVRVHSYWLATLSHALHTLADYGVLEYNRNAVVKQQNNVVPLDTTFEALSNPDVLKHCIFLFTLEE